MSIFFEDEAMRRALVACMALAFGGAPLGVFLMLRRMSLMGDALSHGILPGVATAFLIFGFSPWMMTVGGLAAGLLVACLAAVIARATPLKEDGSLTGLYLIALALGVLLFASQDHEGHEHERGHGDELLHALFGNVLALPQDSLWMIVLISGASLVVFAAIYRGLVAECFDACFLKTVGGHGALYHQAFLVLVVMNLLAAFHAMGTLMGLGLMMLPAIATRLWTRNIDRAVALAITLSLLSSVTGLLAAHRFAVEPGAAIVLMAGMLFVVSVLFGPKGGIVSRFLPHKHLAG